MDWWIWLLVGFGAGFVSGWGVLIWMGRKQLREALGKIKTGKE